MTGHDGHRGVLYYVAVDPHFRVRDLAARPCARQKAGSRQRGVWKMNLLVRSENEAVKGFYEALGYAVNPVLCMARKIST